MIPDGDEECYKTEDAGQTVSTNYFRNRIKRDSLDNPEGLVKKPSYGTQTSQDKDAQQRETSNSRSFLLLSQDGKSILQVVPNPERSMNDST